MATKFMRMKKGDHVVEVSVVAFENVWSKRGWSEAAEEDQLTPLAPDYAAPEDVEPGNPPDGAPQSVREDTVQMAGADAQSAGEGPNSENAPLAGEPGAPQYPFS